MSQKLCLRCGGDCASYATQCIHCRANFKQPHLKDAGENQKVVQLLTEFRHGKSLEEIATSLNDAGIQRLHSDKPWDKQSVAYVIHHFTTTKFDKAQDPSIVLCQSCRTPLIDSTCSLCKNIARHEQAQQETSIGLMALIFNIAVIFVTVIFVYYCANHMTDGQGFSSNFSGLIFSVIAIFGAGTLLLTGNILFIIAALGRSTKIDKKIKAKSELIDIDVP